MEVHSKDAGRLVPEGGISGGGARPHDQFVAFGKYRLDRTAGRLLCDEGHVPLRLKAFSVLEYLLLNPVRLVSKTELLDAVWPETHVSESVLTGCIRDIRRALDDDPKSPRFIETVHRRGYRFIGDLRSASGRFAVPTRWLVRSSAIAARDSELAALAREFAEAVVDVMTRRQPSKHSPSEADEHPAEEVAHRTPHERQRRTPHERQRRPHSP